MRKFLIPAAFVIVAALSAVAQEAPTVTLIDGDRRSTVRYTTSDAKSRVGGAPIFIVVKVYASLNGKRADTRSRTDTPQFELFLNSAANPKSEVQLVKFDIKSKRRQIRLAKTRLFDSSIGFPRDHILPVTVEEIGSRGGLMHYRITPQSPLRRGGEYAIVCGRGGEYPLVRDRRMYFDFGVDK